MRPRSSEVLQGEGSWWDASPPLHHQRPDFQGRGGRRRLLLGVSGYQGLPINPYSLECCLFYDTTPINLLCLAVLQDWHTFLAEIKSSTPQPEEQVSIVLAELLPVDPFVAPVKAIETKASKDWFI